METSFTKSPKRLARKKTDTYSSCMLYDDLVKEKLQGIMLATCNPTIDDGTNFIPSDVPDDDHQRHQYHHHHHYKHTVSEKMFCNCCIVDFSCRQDQRDHYKSDWHRYNLKLKLKGLCSVLEEDFEKIAGDVSSISGSEEDSGTDTETDSSASGGRLKTRPMPIPGHVCSSPSHSGTDSESDSSVWDGNARKYPKVFFKNTLGELFSVYRCLLYHKKNPPSSQTVILTTVMALPQRAKWAVLMTAGGHFAGAVFDGGTLVAHKTFHRYVVRAKRGSAQGNRDSQGNAPKSAGASLRRYNEAALAQSVVHKSPNLWKVTHKRPLAEVQDLMASWSDHLKKCDLIFLRAPSFNRQMFYGGKNPIFKKDNTRIRTIPFATRRPTLNEVKRVYQMLASVEFYGNATDFKDFIPMSPVRHFCYETGKLEIVSEDKLKNIPWRSREKDSTSPLAASPKRLNPDRSSPRMTEDFVKAIPDRVIVDDGHPSSSAASASETELVEVEETISTLHLQEFECTKKPRKKKTKRQRHPSKHQLEPDGDVYAEEKYHLRNSLYTACKVGDVELLKNLLAVFKVMSGSQEESSEMVMSGNKEESSDMVMLENKEESSEVTSLFGNQSTDITNSKDVEKTKKLGEESPDIIISDNVEKARILGEDSPDITINKDVEKARTLGEDSPDITLSKDVKTGTLGEDSPDITISKDMEKSRTLGEDSPDITISKEMEKLRTLGEDSPDITISKEMEKSRTLGEDSPDITISKDMEKSRTLGEDSPDITISKEMEKSRTLGEDSPDITLSKDVEKTRTLGEDSPDITLSKDVERTRTLGEDNEEISNNTVGSLDCDTDRMTFDDNQVNLPSTDTKICDIIVSDSDSTIGNIVRYTDAESLVSCSQTQVTEMDVKPSENDNSLTDVKKTEECSIPITNIITVSKESDSCFDTSVSDTKSHSLTKKPSLLSTSPRHKSGGNCLSELSPLMAADILNEPFGDNETTLLHVSSKSGHAALITLLLDAGADPSVKEKSGKVPYLVGSNKETRNEFRRFMAQNPDKYDYVSAQVPCPLTAEMEAVKKKKDLEKKKIQKKIKNEKMKEKKVEMAKQRKEVGEQKRFLALSDREKRALAADKRLVQQLEMQGEIVPVLSRCWQCASDMTGKIPFQYFDYKFCSPKCLQTHRKKDKS